MRLQFGFMHPTIEEQLAQQGLEIYRFDKPPGKQYDSSYYERIRESINLLHLRDYIDIHEYNRCTLRLYSGIKKNIIVMKEFRHDRNK